MNDVQPHFAAPDAHPLPYQPLGLAVLLREVAAGHDVTPLGQRLLDHAQHHDDADALLELSLVLQLKYQKAPALAVQAQAIQLRRQYRVKHARSAASTVKLLALKAPGDLMANTPFECLLEGVDVQVDVVYVDGGRMPDMVLPEHDVILAAACASDDNTGYLAQISALTRGAARRVLNRPECIALTTRDAAYALLGKVPGICMAHTVRLSRARVAAAAAGDADLSTMVDGRYPFIVRPVGSHAGQGLAKVRDRHELARYLDDAAAEEYYVAPFIDYRSADGLFRKYRIVMIEGRPFVCHMGISHDWMVHYPYAEMIAHPERRDEEARLMATFDEDFAVRHGAALDAIARRTGLDYVGFDCAESTDGRLVVFEIATGMVVHDMDDPDTFPYKLPQMRRVFQAFHEMLCRAAVRPC